MWELQGPCQEKERLYCIWKAESHLLNPPRSPEGSCPRPHLDNFYLDLASFQSGCAMMMRSSDGRGERSLKGKWVVFAFPKLSEFRVAVA
jgi:hypothetical protein